MTLTTAEIAVGSALVGALVGGLSTTVGGEWAATRRMRREELYRMHAILLPEWRRSLGPGSRNRDGPSPGEVLADLARSAVVAGRGASAKVRAVATSWDAVQASPLYDEENPPLGPGRGRPLSAERIQRRAELGAATAALETYLGESLS